MLKVSNRRHRMYQWREDVMALIARVKHCSHDGDTAVTEPDIILTDDCDCLSYYVSAYLV